MIVSTSRFPFARRRPMHTHGVTLLTLTVLVSILLSGCSTGPPVTKTYQENRNRTKYATEPMRLSNARLNSSYRSPPRFYVMVSGTCEGRNCTPSHYNMQFSMDNDTPVEMAARTLTIYVDGNEFSFPAPDQDRPDQTIRLRGIIRTVKLTPDQLRQIGRSSSVRGEIAGIPFQLSERNRQPIIDLLVRTNTISDPSPETSR